MNDYRPIVKQAYHEILNRDPDPGGLESWNKALNAGTTEAQMREAFMRSAEYASRFPGEVAPPPPPPPPVPGGPMSLVVDGNRFLNMRGEVVKLLGVGGVCCTVSDPPQPSPDLGSPAKVCGWPMISDTELHRIAAHHGNFVHIRTGPFTVAGEGPGFNGYLLTADGRYDLNQWNPDFWRTLRSRCVLAKALGIWAEVDVLDGWMVRSGGEDSPYEAEHNVQGERYVGCDVFKSTPPPCFLAWVAKVVETVGDLTNVLFHLGNENFVCKPAPEYELSFASVIRAVESRLSFPRHLIGSNTADDTTPFDYIERHASEAQYPLARPLMVNEYDDEHPSLTPEAFGIEAAAAYRWGTSFHLWMGQQSPVEWLTSLAYLQQIVDGTRAPIPDECATLVKWKAGVFSAMDPGAQIIDKAHPVANGFVRGDSTPFFRTKAGLVGKCNTEGDVCSGRRCEDPRGGRWTQLEGPPAHWRVSNPGPDTGYSINIGGIARRGTIPLAAGHYVFEVRSLPDAHDGEIPPKPLQVAGDVHGRVEFTVT